MTSKLRKMTAVILTAGLLATPVGAGAFVELPGVIKIPAGPFVLGSDAAEREAAYRLDEAAYGHRVTRDQAWYASESSRRRVQLGVFRIARTPITNAQYFAFVEATGYPAPDVDALTWAGYNLIHAYPATRKYAWQNGRPPEGRENHPVVLINHADAKAYAAWLSKLTKRVWRLPIQAEWEKAARGRDASLFPWGNIYDPAKLNSADQGPFDTTAVGSYPQGASPYGMLDAAGQVFEWTASRDGKERYIVKGGSWDDKGCGVCRPAARHSRPKNLKHILIGFRLVRE